jgi:hypothetical protein
MNEIEKQYNCVFISIFIKYLFQKKNPSIYKQKEQEVGTPKKGVCVH